MTPAELNEVASMLLGGSVPAVGREALLQQIPRMFQETQTMVSGGAALKNITWFVCESPSGLEASVLVTDDLLEARYPGDVVDDLRVYRGKARSRVCCLHDTGKDLVFLKFNLRSLAGEAAARARPGTPP